MTDLKLPKKIGDKFTTNRFHEGEAWEEVFTVAGFYISFWDRLSNTFSKLSRLLKTNNATVKDNMNTTLPETDYKQHQIMVKIKETGGSVPLRDCIKL